jgi:hypothetical protein
MTTLEAASLGRDANHRIAQLWALLSARSLHNTLRGRTPPVEERILIGGQPRLDSSTFLEDKPHLDIERLVCGLAAELQATPLLPGLWIIDSGGGHDLISSDKAQRLPIAQVPDVA